MLVGPIQEAFAQASPREDVVFYFSKPLDGARVQATSGKLFVQESLFYISVSNFQHPVVVTARDVGATDRLDDVRETTAYVHDHPALSVGEQDFVIFFDDPGYQMEHRGIELFGYPERTLAIAYRSFLAANPDLQKREVEIQDALQHATMGKGEGQAIADLKRRVAELDQTNRALADKLHERSFPASVPPPAPTPSSSLGNPPADSQATLLEMIKHLEQRITGLEEQLRQTAPKKSKKKMEP